MYEPFHPWVILRLAEIYSEAKDQPLRKTGREAVGAHQFFVRLGRGEGCTMRCAQRAFEYFNKNWPPAAHWPENIPRSPARPRKTETAPATVEVQPDG